MNGLPTIRLAEPHELLTAQVRAAWLARHLPVVDSWREIDSAAYLHDEAALLSADELADAKAALSEDGIFPEREWSEIELRAATKYGWALAHAEQETRNLQTDLVVWNLERGETATTPAELRFLLAELRRRQVPITHLAPCWPVTLEPACAVEERTEAFQRVLSEFTPIIRESGFGLAIPHVAGKVAEFRMAVESLGAGALLDFAMLGWLEAARIMALQSPELFRRVLECAQEHFAFDKPPLAFSTTEDDIRTLPVVEDHDLVRVFIEDFRGRQLLHIPVRSIFADAALREPLGQFLTSARTEINTAIGVEIDRHVTVAS